MSFSRFEAAAISRPGSRAGVKAALRVRKDGVCNMTLTIPIGIAGQVAGLATATRCNVLVGDNEDAGQLRLEFGQEGDVGVCLSGRRGLRRLTLRAPPGTPGSDKGATPCVLVDLGPDHLTFELPLSAWERQSPAVGGPASPWPAAPKPPPAPPPVIKSSGKEPGHGEHKLDACRYLAKKGLDLAQPRPGEYRLGDMIISEAEVLRRINAYRKDENLRAITALDLA